MPGSCTSTESPLPYTKPTHEGARSQGGQLDLHEHNGQLALQKAGLLEKYRSIIHVGGVEQRVVDQDGMLLAELPDGGSMGSPEALRGDICRILLASLPDGTVRWGKKLQIGHSSRRGGMS